MAYFEPDILLKLISKGDKDAFRKLFDRFYPELINYSAYLVGSKFPAEEIVSSVFVSLWKNRTKLTKINNIKTYLYISVKHKSYNYHRDNQAFISGTIDLDEPNLKMVVENPESLYLDAELQEKVLQSIDNLPPKTKLVFRMIKEEGLKYREVAEMLDISVKTVEVHMGRAVTKLRSALDPYLNQSAKSEMPVSKIANFIISSLFLFIF